VLRPPG
jgi:hypothetical protein